MKSIILLLLHQVALVAPFSFSNAREKHLTSSQETTNISNDLPSIINASPLLSFHRDLVEIQSISNAEEEVGNYIASFLQSKNLTVEKQFIDKNRFNVYAYIGNDSFPEILVTSHIDTVPPYIPYSLSYPSDANANHTAMTDRKSVIINGRGSVDAKGSVAAQVFAVLETLGKDPSASLGLLFVVGEENSGVGMSTFSNSKYNPSPSSFHTVIFGEPTDLNLVSGHKGGIGFNLTSKGKAAHSGYPWLGRNAISGLLPVASYLEKLGDIPVEEGGLPNSSKYGNATVNLALIHGGVAANVVPASAEAVFSVRVASGTSEQVKQIVDSAFRKFTSNDPNIQIAFREGGLPITNLDTDVDGFKITTVNYGTDIPNLVLHGGPRNRPVKRYLYGPGSIHVAHGDDEALTVGDLEAAVEGYRRLIDSARVRYQE